MKNLILPFIIAVAPLTACNSSENISIPDSSIHSKEVLSPESLKIINEYNSIIQNAHNFENDDVTKSKLKSILPQLNKINSAKERNSILLNTYLRLEEFDQAYNLTEKILATEKKPNMQNFQCLLMETLNKDKPQIKKCYELASALYKIDVEKLKSNNPKYTFTLWNYYSNMYQAGHEEYIGKLKQIIKDQKHESDKQMYQTLYEIETNPNERKSLLDSLKLPN
ncbi:hypothetical protein [Acinetobacter silvestris]|uniref:Tetratricopeptide repeat protein n=1 Tax=Acinetobacter silvestris TaxID=1977882 RepID=A0A1Y3CIT1_9GAMM|nr:hypothetical protein [Acinetobacter silvestris]OTG65053.1 hypothetical protein B9T28_09665 [Acinetobacter silvestris]